jgi:signal transduction histidine kinase
MEPSALLDKLAGHRALGAAPREELEWLATHGEVHSFSVGAITTRKAQPEEWLHILLSGHVAIHVDRGAGERRVIQWRAGEVFGLMPYSRGAAPPGDTVVEKPTETLAIHRDLFPEMVRECPGVTARLVHAMLDRARHFTSSDLLDEKLVSLGKLAAGLAHELNNPASAAARSAKLLMDAPAGFEAAARALAASGLTGTQWAAIDRVRELCEAAPAPMRSPMERADREEAIGVWLQAHGVDAAVAEPLADTRVTIDALDRMSELLDAAALDAAIRWIAAGCTLRALSADIDRSASRIHQLVSAVKGFTYMDHATVPEAVDLSQGIADTVAVLSGKAREKAVSVCVNLPTDLPRIRAFGGELNQVWANVIDNAIDAAPTSGRVDVTASRDAKRVIVHIVDNGPGIPAEIHARIFDPFFTTKEVGQGTGLGLDIARRLMQRQSGEIEVESRPGRTEFRVSLPVGTLD